MPIERIPPVDYQADKPTSSEAIKGKSYREVIEPLFKDTRLGEIYSYDKEGNLCLNRFNPETHNWEPELRLAALASYLRTPVCIVDTRNITDNVHQWQAIAHTAALKANYHPEKTLLAYATKANTYAPTQIAAYTAGCAMEISSQIGAMNANYMLDNGLIDRKTSIFCNGFKADPNLENRPGEGLPENLIVDSSDSSPKRQIVFEGDITSSKRVFDESYMQMIKTLRAQGANIIPIIDSPEELSTWAQIDELPAEGIDLGVRLKLYDTAENDAEELQIEARHGMEWETVKKVSDTITRINESTSNSGEEPRLRLTTFHAMVTAAEKKDLGIMVNTLLYAGRKFYEIKKNHPEMEFFDFGGGMPSPTEGYQYEEFLTKLMTGLKELSEEYHMDVPTIVGELGSYVVADSATYLTKVVQSKSNSVDKDGGPQKWHIVDLPLQRSLPDTWGLRVPFSFLAAKHANLPCRNVTIGDYTCDKDGRYPPRINPDIDTILIGLSLAGFPQEDIEKIRQHAPEILKQLKKHQEKVPMPDIGWDEIIEGHIIAIPVVGAYQMQLAANNAAVGHSEQTGVGLAFIYEGDDNKTRIFVTDRPNSHDAMSAYGFNQNNLPVLRKVAKKDS